jgi:CBS domain-containing protein
MPKIADVMTRDVCAVRRNEPVSTAAKLMWDADCGAVPVLDEQGDAVVGMITDRDICMASWTQDRPASAIPVASAMSDSLCYCSPEDDLASAVNLMRSRRVRRIPVLSADHHLAGIISLADLVRTEHQRRPVGAFENAVISTMAEITKAEQSRSG